MKLASPPPRAHDDRCHQSRDHEGAEDRAQISLVVMANRGTSYVPPLPDGHGSDGLLRHLQRLLTLCLIVCSVLATPGCSLRAGGGKLKPIAAAPKPAAPDPPSSDTASDLPLSVPQTQVTLPSPQPIQAEALATVRPESQPSPEPANPAVRPPRSTPPRNESRQQAIGPPQPAAAPPATQPSRVRIRPVESAAERRRLMAGINTRKRQVQEILGKVRNRTLTEAQKSAVERIQAFLEQTDAALKDQDLQQADALSNRALLLSQVLN